MKKLLSILLVILVITGCVGMTGCASSGVYKFSSLTNEDANKTFNVNVVVETIQKANNAANSVWTTAPADWIDTYSPLPASVII